MPGEPGQADMLTERFLRTAARRAAPRAGGRFAIAASRALLAVCIPVCIAVPPARSGPALVVDTQTGEILHSHLASVPWRPASLTKLMTAYVTFRAIGEGRIGLQSPVTIGSGRYAPSAGLALSPGTTFTVDEALMIMLAGSVNPVAQALAEAVSGSEGAFVAEMNETARAIGMTDTVYANSHGLHDPGHVTTARDLALLTRTIVREFPQYHDFFEVRSVRVGQTELRNHNGLLGAFAGADGMKTGYVCESGYNLVATASRADRHLAAVVLGAFSEGEREAVAETLLEAGFASAAPVSIPGSAGRPVSPATPVNMRPYVCGKEKPPAGIASFGLDSGHDPAAGVPLPRPRP